MDNIFDYWDRSIRHQERINQSITVFAVVTALYIISIEANSHLQDAKIKKLTRELRELKRSKGD